MRAVQSVLGPVTSRMLGRVDYHEHLFQVSPLLKGEELDDEDASRAEAAVLRQSGFMTMVDATPLGLGRRPDALARIAQHVGLTIVAATGAHRQEHYIDADWVLELSSDELASRFIKDLTVGMTATDNPPTARTRRSPVRAGVLKIGIGYWRVSNFERRVLAAVGKAHAHTQAPVMVHLEYCSAAHEILNLLESAGVRPTYVALAHVDRNLDPHLHGELAARGAYLGFDGVARHRRAPDSAVLECLIQLAQDSHGDKLLLGSDMARASRYINYGGIPGLAYLGERFVPRIGRAAGPQLVEQILVTNPASWLCGNHRTDTRLPR